MLRDYQVESINLIRQQFQLGNRKVLLYLATGAGKTVVFCDMLKTAAARGKSAMVVTRGRKIVDQASNRLLSEGVQHSTNMSGHWNFRPHLPISVCSIDTMMARGMRPKADLIIIDEVHQATSKGYKEFISDYPNAFVVGVTATPWTHLGLRHCVDVVVHPITMTKLIEQGYLVPFRYFAPQAPDLSGVHVSASTHDYIVDELEGAMTAGGLTGKVIDHWIHIANGRPTLCFGVNVHHSLTLTQRFIDAGISAEHCDANTSDDDREAIIRRLERGETKVVCNVGILGVGFDAPCVSAIIMARPTKSKNLFVQQAGRGSRPLGGKSDCIILDHSGNILRHGMPTDEDDVDLDGRSPTEGSAQKTKICPECYAAYRGACCPECGVIAPTVTKAPEESEERLVEIKEIDPVLRAFKNLIKEAKKTGKKRAWAYHKLVERFGFLDASPYLPEWFINANGNPFAGSPYRGFSR